MDIALDTNAHASDYAMTSPSFTGLFDYLRKSESRLISFKLVREELLATYRREFIEQVLPRWEKWARLVIRPSYFEKPALERQVEALEKALKASDKVASIVLVDTYDDVSLDEVVRRGIHRIPPASDKGEELRDVVLWLSVLAYAKRENRSVAFISKDSGFWQRDIDAVKQQIQEDIASAKADVRVFRTIESFLAVNTLQEKPVNPELAARLFTDLNLGKHMLERALAVEIPGAVLTAGETLKHLLQNGVSYDVGGGAEFVEVSYWALFKALIEMPDPLYGFVPKIGDFGTNKLLADWPQVSALDYGLIGKPTLNQNVLLAPQEGFLRPINSTYLTSGFATVSPPMVSRNINIEVTSKFSVRLANGNVSSASLDSVKGTITDVTL